jgi:hypothetical protein
MNAFTSRATVVFTALLAIACPALAAKYKATILHPVGFFSSHADGVSGSTQVGWAWGDSTLDNHHAFLWNGTAGSWIDLTPPGFGVTRAFATTDTSQIGIGVGAATAHNPHALLWHGTAASYVDLHPYGFDTSSAAGVDGPYQVGNGSSDATNNRPHALLWQATPESAVDLHPTGFWQSFAEDVSGNSQVGYGSYGIVPFSGLDDHALLWSGTPESVVDLHPDGFEFYSRATAVSGDTQVGYGRPESSDRPHALLWKGTAESVVDLHPAGFIESVALDVSGDTQVGRGNIDSPCCSSHALLWQGSAESVIDLHEFLTGLGPTFTHSEALGIAANGDIVGTASFEIDAEYDEPYVVTYAIQWTPVPEPSALTLLVCALTALLNRQRTRRSRAHNRAVMQRTRRTGRFSDQSNSPPSFPRVATPLRTSPFGCPR